MNPIRILPTRLLSAALMALMPFAAFANPDPEGCCQCLEIDANQSMLGGGSPSSPASPVTNTQGELEVTISVTLSSDEDCSDVTIDSVNIRPVGEPGISIGINGQNKAFVDPALVRIYGNQWEVVVKCTRTQPKKSESICTKSFNLTTGCSSCDMACENTASISVEGDEGLSVSIPTTSSEGGMATGTLRYYNQGSTYLGRGGVFASVPSEFGVTRDASGSLTQIDAGDVLIDLEDVVGENAFTITHTIQGQPSPFRTTKIAMVTDNGITFYRVDTTFDGVTRRWEQSHPQPDTRVLDQGAIINGSFESITRQVFSESKPSPGVLIKRATTYERASSDTPWSAASRVSDIETTWENQIRGWVQTKQVIDPDGTALTSTWEYYQPGELTGPNAATEGLGRLKHHLRYDGYESFHTYSLNQSTVTTPYAGNPAGKITTTTWNPGSQTRMVETSVNGQVVSKTITAHTATSQTQTQHTSGSETLTTVTHFKPSGQDFGGRPVRTLHPDGTLTTYSYVRDAQTGGYTTTVDNGLPNAGKTAVTQGIRTITTVNSRGTTIHRKTEAIGYGTGTAVFDEMAVTGIDHLGRVLTTAYFPTSVTFLGEFTSVGSAAWSTSTEYSCCGIAKETDRHGIETFHAYEHLQRRTKSNRLGVTTETHYLGLTTETHRYPEAVSASLSPALNGSSTTLVSRSVRNLAGTLQESWSPNPTSEQAGALVKSNFTVTTYAPEPGLSRRTVTTTADNSIQTTDSFLDSRTAATYGDLAPAMQYTYSVNTTGELTTQAYVVGENHYETTSTQSDWAGRTVATLYMNGTAATMHYNSKGQLVRMVDPDEVVTLYAYNAKGERTTTAIDLVPSATYNDEINNIHYGTDTVQFSETVPAMHNGAPVWRTISRVWQNDDTSPGGTIVSQSERSPDGLQSRSWQIGQGPTPTDPDETFTQAGATFTHTLTTLGTGGNWTTTQTNPDDTFGITSYVDGRMVSSAMFAAGADPEEDAPIVATGQTYDDWNRPASTTDSRTGTTTTAYMSATNDAVKSVTDPGARKTEFAYDNRGRQIEVKLPDNTVTTTTYTPRGEVAGRSGSQTYPVTYTYDYAGRQATMTTYGTEQATTTWTYRQDRGFLERKQYPDGKGTEYTYTDAGRLQSRTWSRSPVANQPPLATGYSYDAAGRLVATAYTDATPSVTITYDALGRQLTQSNGLATSTFTYNSSNLQIDTETITYTLPGQDPFTRVLDRSQDNLGRDTGWTLGAPTSSSASEAQATYTYFGATGRLETVSNSSDTFTYTYTTNSNLVATITGPEHTVTNTWESNRNVLASKENELPGGTLSKFSYSVNDIGQRNSLATTGSAFGNTDRGWNWAYDEYGQVTAATHADDTDLNRSYDYDAIGNRLASEISNNQISDPAGPNTTTYTPNALNQYSQITNNSTTNNPEYDSDGNMTSGPLPAAPESASSLTWDGENRLIEATVDSTTVTYHYDAQSRLISRSVGVSPTSSTLYLYDGWNRIAEYEKDGTGHELKRTYLWGMDLSGSMQGAGGVGGLLSMTLHDTTTETFYPTYDGNGNISEYVDQAGEEAAHFEYDPFGNLTVDTHNNAATFPYRFSTKPQDHTTGLYYYGYRYYDPVTGRWPSRDPIEEEGGINLYGFVGNNGVGRWDYLGFQVLITEDGVGSAFAMLLIPLVKTDEAPEDCICDDLVYHSDFIPLSIAVVFLNENNEYIRHLYNATEFTPVDKAIDDVRKKFDDNFQRDLAKQPFCEVDATQGGFLQVTEIVTWSRDGQIHEKIFRSTSVLLD